MTPAFPFRLPALRVALSALACAALLAAPRAAARDFALSTDGSFPASRSGEDAFHLDGASLLSAGEEPAGPRPLLLDSASAGEPAPRLDGATDPATVSAAPAAKDRSWFVATSFTAAFLGLEYLAFWQSAELSEDFQFANEGWFDPDTYSGGADKASHLIGGYIAGRFLESALRWGGSTPEKAQLLSAALIGLTGTLIEVGDAYHGFGFSWQDALITTSGGVIGSLLAHYKLDDTITMRWGRVGIDQPDDASVVIGSPNHYSAEMYTADVRLAGLLPRLGKKAGAARFLLASVAYGTKGYPWVEAPYRQRRLGLEIALDTYEIGLALGIPKDSWWGGPTLAFLRYFRIPYTGIGVQYEFNSRRWMGPNSFHSYDR